MTEPLKIHYDIETDRLRVNDTLFAGDLFRQIGSLLPLGRPFAVFERKIRDDGSTEIVLEALTDSQIATMKVNEAMKRMDELNTGKDTDKEQTNGNH